MCLRLSLTDWVRIDTMRDEDIDTSDIPELDDSFFDNAVICWPQPKASVTLRIDRVFWIGSNPRARDTRPISMQF
jgi:hypothetical protein